jgi:hypothetical protein
VKPCALKKAVLWVHVMDDRGEAVKGIEVDVAGAKKSSEDSGFARFDPVKDSEVLAVTLPAQLPDAYDDPQPKSGKAQLAPGEVGYVSFSLPRKPKLKVKVVQKGVPAKLFGKADVKITGKAKSKTATKTSLDGTGLADLEFQTADEYTVEVTLDPEDAKGFFVPALAPVTLAAGDDKEVPVEVEPINVVTPKIVVEYKVVLLDRNLSTHQGVGETKIFADPTRVEVSFTETNPDYTHDTGAVITGAKVKIYTDEGCQNELVDGKLTKADLEKGKVKELYLRGTAAGTFDLTLTLNDPSDKAKAKLDQNPAKVAMAVVELQLEAYSAKKAHSKVLVDDDAPTHTKLSDEDKIKKGRLLVLQDGDGRHGRAKVVVKKPDDALWTTGDADYEVHVVLKAASGALKLFDAETAGTLKKDLGSGALELKKTDLGADLTLWAEGSGVSDDFRQTWLHLALDRPIRDLPKKVKACGDVARFTVIDVAKVTPDTDDYKQYVNLPADVSHPEHGRKLKPKAKLTKALENVELMFSLVPDAANVVDIPDTVKHDKPKDTDAAVKTDNQGEVATAELKLSIHGGDKFKIAVYPLEAPPPKKVPPAKCLSKDIEIWRELFYTVVCMQRYDGATDYSDRLDLGGVSAKLADGFVKFTAKGAAVIKPFTSVVKDSQIATWNGTNFAPDADRTINIGMIEAQTGNASQPVDRAWDANADFAAGTKVSTETLNGFTFDLSARTEWLDSASYLNTDVPGVWTPLAPDTLTLALDALTHKLRVDLSTIVTGGVTVDKIKLKAKLKKLPEWSGDKTGKCILIGMRFREIGYPGQVPDSARQTTLHETGHFLGLAPAKLGNNAQGANGRLYQSNGPHCNFNVNQCTMYHAFRMVFDYCDHCTGSLKSRDLTSPPIASTAGY